ncbi:MAG: septation protein SepH [Propioniciclava sp.]
MDSELRPREIQARIRAGESAEVVARAAGMPIERVNIYAGPVLAEREHIVGLARQHPVRRRSETTAHRLLSKTVTDNLAARGLDPDAAIWDAWKLADRRWRVLVTFVQHDQEIAAAFSYEQAGHFSVADNDIARALIGDDRRTQPPPSAPAATNDDLAIVRAVQTSQPDTDESVATEASAQTAETEATADPLSDDVEDAFHEGQLTEVDGVYEIVQEPTSNLDVLYDMLASFDEDSVRVYSGLVHPLEDSVPVIDADPGEDQLSPEELDLTLPSEPSPPEALEEAPAVALQEVETPPDEPEQLSLIDDVEPPPAERRPKPRGRRKRASVPSWDEIMFGGPKGSGTD